MASSSCAAATESRTTLSIRNSITNLRFSPPFVNTVTVTSFTGGNTLANLVAGTFPGPGGRERKPRSTFNPLQSDFGQFSPVDQNLENPRNQQWDAGVEYQVGVGPRDEGYLRRSAQRAICQASQPVNLVNPANIPAAPTSLADQTARLAEFQTAFQSERWRRIRTAQQLLIDPTVRCE